MTFGGLGNRRRSFRRGQSLVLFGLAMLVVVAAAIGPLFERAVEQADVRSTLTSADRVSRGLSLLVDPNVTAAQAQPSGRAAKLFRPGVHTLEIPATTVRAVGASTTLVYRDDDCRHLRLASGRCPDAPNEVLLSAPSAAAMQLSVGGHVVLRLPDSKSASFTFKDTETVVGLYLPFSSDDDYWFGAQYSSTGGLAQTHDGNTIDAIFGSQNYLLEVARRLNNLTLGSYVRSYIDMALIPGAVGVDDIGLLRRMLGASTLPGSSTPVQVQSALSTYLDQVDAGRRAARTVVIPEAISLVLLAGIAFGVVVAAAADQRRPELALARLRGNGVRATARLFARELGALTVAAIVPGLLLAWGLAALACRTWLVSGANPELRLPVVEAVAGAAVLMFAIVAAVGRRTSGQEITGMLRQLPSRPSRRGLGLTEAMLVVAALAGLVATLNGGKHTVFAALTPTFLAVVLGMATSRLAIMVARRAGRRALWRGKLARSYAALNIGRRPGSRLTVTVLCVATALLVFAGQQWSVAAVNRQQRAVAETGAAVTLDVATPNVQALVGAVRAGDPSRAFATPVVEIDPPGVGAVPTVAVDPASFGSVASWGRAAVRPSPTTLSSIILPHQAPAVAFKGENLHLKIGFASYSLIDGGGPASKQQAGVLLEFLRSDGQQVQADFGLLPRLVSAPQTFSSTVACDDGCSLTGVEISRPVLQQGSIAGEFLLAGLTADTPSGPVALSLGKSADWASTTPRTQIFGSPRPTSMSARDASGGVDFTLVDGGSGTSMQYLALPLAAPVLLAGAKPTAVDSLGYTDGASLDGGVGRIKVVGSVPFVPQSGGSAVLEDLDLAVRSNLQLSVTARASVWLRTTDSAREQRLRAALQAAGIHVIARHTATAAEKQFAASAPGWSARFALVVGVLAEILAIVLLVLVLLSSRRVRERDLASLRLTGLPASLTRRSSALELVVLILTGVVSGTIAGIAGAALSMSAIPLFTATATVPLPATFGLQPVWLVGVVGLSLILLVPMGVSLGSWIAKRARPEHALGEAT